MSNKGCRKPNEFYLKKLKNYAKDRDSVSLNDIKNEPSMPSPTSYKRRFGSWNEAKKTAGLENINLSPDRYTEEELLNLLREANEKLNSGSFSELKQSSEYPDPKTYARRFGSLIDARKKAGLDTLREKRKGKFEFECSECGETSHRNNSYKKNSADNLFFCSPECQFQYFTGSKNPSWNGGNPNGYGNGWKNIRSKVLDRDNYQCARCNNREDNVSYCLEVHHIIPCRNFEDIDKANKMCNLVTLCRSCHRKIEEWPVLIDTNNREFKDILSSKSIISSKGGE